MKKLFSIVTALIFSCDMYAQSNNMSDGHTPIIDPPAKKCKISLSLPDTMVLCSNSIILVARGLPAGGLYDWSREKGLGIYYTNKGKSFDYGANVEFSSIIVDYSMWKMWQPQPAYNSLGAIKVTYRNCETEISKICIIKLSSKSPREEYDAIRSIFCVAFGEAKKTFPTLGSGYLGNILKREALCLIIQDTLQAICTRLLKGKKFCHFRLGRATSFYALTGDLFGWGHTFVALLDRNEQLYQYADPWAEGDCLFRDPPKSNDVKQWEISSWPGW